MFIKWAFSFFFPLTAPRFTILGHPSPMASEATTDRSDEEMGKDEIFQQTKNEDDMREEDDMMTK